MVGEFVLKHNHGREELNIYSHCCRYSLEDRVLDHTPALSPVAWKDFTGPHPFIPLGSVLFALLYVYVKWDITETLLIPSLEMPRKQS